MKKTKSATTASLNEDYQHYRILRRADGELWELGHGAMGLTFKAEDLNLRCPVALKIISPHLVDSRQAREFFLAEARGAASLRHRNVAAVHHLGTHKDSFFYVMEFVEGETVDTLIRRQGRLDAPVALDIAQQTACALAAAGRRGLVHRDIKPANLMLTDEGDGTLVVKVIDFGLCKSLRGVAPAQSGARRDARDLGDSADDGDGFLGTPHFASPEQIRNEPDVDGRADFYSLGASLWQMLSGRPPFTGSVDEVRSRHLADPPPLSQLPADLPDAARNLLARLLEKDPTRRPQSPAELIDAIEGAAYALKSGDLNTTWKTGGCVPLVGTVLKHNFHLEAVVSDDFAASGPVFRAEDLAGQRLVSVRLLDRAQPLEPMHTAIARLLAAPHPNIVFAEALSSCRNQPFLVSEWVNGFPLANVLRARDGALPAIEAQPLIHQAARAVDHARAHGLGRLDLRLDAAFVHFSGEEENATLDAADLRALPSQPLGEWPAFLLKLRLVDETTAAAADGGISAVADDPVRALGHFAAELLGSNAAETVAFSALAKTQRLQLPGIPRPISDVVGRAVSADSGFSSGTEFVEALTEAGRLE